MARGRERIAPLSVVSGATIKLEDYIRGRELAVRRIVIMETLTSSVALPVT